MPADEPQYKIRLRKRSDPEGNFIRFYEVGEMYMVGGEKKIYWNKDIAFDTEEEAKSWVKEQSTNESHLPSQSW